MRLAAATWAVMVVVVVVAGIVDRSGAANSTHTYFVKAYSGRYVDGPVVASLKGVSLVQCAAVCGPRRVFNVRGSYPTFTCHCISSFNALYDNPLYSVYYDKDMYQDYGFYPAMGRLLYVPSPNWYKTTWSNAYWTCRNMWAHFLVPQTQEEWEEMKLQVADVSVNGMWVGLEEGKEGAGFYYWVGAVATEAPGAINIVIQDDNVTKSWEDFDGTLWLRDDDYDCGALQKASTGQEVAILNCYEPLYAGYVCEALFPPL